MKTYSSFKILICFYIEKVHRKVYDNQMEQKYILTFKDKFLLFWYDLLLKIYPDFRSYLKKWKKILIRAYKQNRLSLVKIFAYRIIRKINTERYSPYLNFKK